ncbi:hypothetical protein [Acinetobacter sp. Marseille-Q1618]|uniref:hypothetical protein n=1 Tax=Acinetobacter sp. Marseille-Q1618 TaxID=2697502 RepID=UPI00156EA9EB|nr:hypothetical protein [Acinetobacter sp. Marseille-Q1618]
MKKFVLGLVSLFLLAASSLSGANVATLDGWGITNLTPDGAKSRIDAQKTIADIAKKSHAMILPTAKDVSKVLARGAGGLALSIAVEELLDAVDWVLDPANNQIVYTLPPEKNPKLYPFLYGPDSAFLAIEPSSSCILQNAANAGSWVGEITYSNNGGPYGKCVGENFHGWEVNKYPNLNYDPNAKPEEKTLPLETVAAQVISNAESDDADAQAATTAAAQDILNEAEQDAAKAQPIVNQLEANAKEDDVCYEEWSFEVNQCDVWRFEGPDEDPDRWYRACKDRAADRLRLCYRNGGQPDPFAPPPWSKNDL